MHIPRQFFATLLAVVLSVTLPSVAGANDLVGKLQKTQPATGVVTGAGVDRYPLDVPPGGGFVISLSEKGDHVAGFTPRLELKDPAGHDAGDDGGEFFVVTSRANAAFGNWQVEVSRKDGGQKGGEYTLNLLRINSATATTLDAEKPYTSSLVRGAVDTYAFDVPQPDPMHLSLKFKNDNGFSPEVTVFDPGGQNIGSGTCTKDCDLNVTAFTQAGIYTVMVWRGDRHDGADTYTLSRANGASKEGQALSNPQGTAGNISVVNADIPPCNTPPCAAEPAPLRIESGKVVSGLLKGSAFDSYAFTAVKGGSFMISLGRKGGGADGFMPDIDIASPDGRHAGGADKQRVGNVQSTPEAGEWKIKVRRSDGGQDGGDYELRLLQIPGITGKPLLPGTPQAGKMTGGAVDVYTIKSQPGVAARVDLTPAAANGFLPQMNIFAPNGEFMGNTNCTQNCSTQLFMKDEGDYTVLVSRIDQNAGEGAYSIALGMMGGTPALGPVPAAAMAPVAIDTRAVFAGEAVPVVAEKMRPMARAAYIYRDRMFLPLGLQPQISDDHKLADAHDAAMELDRGDIDPISRDVAGWWVKAAADGSLAAVNRLGMLPDPYKSYLDKDYTPAAWYRKVVEQGLADRIFVSSDLLQGGGTIKDYAAIKNQLTPLAERGSAVAQFDLGVIYALGYDAAPNFAEAAKWYAMAADQGLIAAQHNLGELYEQGQGEPQNDAAAVKWYMAAAGAGYPASLYRLGLLAEKGRGMPKDAAKAKAWLKQAANAGIIEAQAQLAALDGKTPEAMKLWQDAAAHGNTAALQKLVEDYQKNGVPPASRDMVLALYRKVAEEVNPVAFTGLGDFFAKQPHPDYFEAYYWYSLVADAEKSAYLPPAEMAKLKVYAAQQAGAAKKHLGAEALAVTKWRIDDRHPQAPGEELDAAAQIYLHGMDLYQHGDRTSSLIYIMQAAHMGLGIAQYAVAMNEEGDACAPCDAVIVSDIAKAIEDYKLAVMSGYVGAATRIGRLYQFGIGVAPDLLEAAKWYHMDMSRGYAPAMNYLGSIYLRPGQADGGKAVDMYEKAAARDLVSANDALGMIYLYGAEGVAPDPSKALKWYRAAADKGDDVGAVQVSAILVNGPGHDYAEAAKLLSSFASPVAYNNLAYLYEHGLIPQAPQSPDGNALPAAIELYKKSSDMCYGQAMYHIGLIYARGGAPSSNISTALVWMKTAAAYGSRPADAWLKAYNPDLVMRSPPKEFQDLNFPPKPCPAPKGAP